MNRQATKTKNTEAMRKLRRLIRGIPTAMLTTIDADGNIRSRPMATQAVGQGSDLWFFTRLDTAKVRELKNNSRVNLCYCEPVNNHYVSISGRVELVHDSARVRQLWSPAFFPWVPKGLDDPALALLRVEVERARYWDSPSGSMVELVVQEPVSPALIA